MTAEKYIQEKESFFFELDDVIYPEKDYLLQVFYLFAQFMEYGEQMDAAAILKYMQETYLEEGRIDVYAKTALTFNIPDKYQVNFNLLLESVRLPLKLIIYDEVLKFLQAIVLERKRIFLIVKGYPAMQLNKIKQTEWNGLEKYLTVFFTEEFEPGTNVLKLMIDQHQLDSSKILFVGNSLFAEISAAEDHVDYLDVNELFIV